MTAHDDDQDLVTIRIPRRVAAMYAAELDFGSTPAMVHLNSLAPYIGAAVFFALSIWFAVSALWRYSSGEVTSAYPGVIFAAGSALVSFGLVYVGCSLRRALRKRGLI